MAPRWRRSTRPPRRTPTSSGCRRRRKSRRRSCSCLAICPAASLGRPWTSTAGSTRPDMSGRTARTNVGTVDELHASATKACGLDDFGVEDDNYREALGVLLDSYAREAGFTELGSKMSRFFVRNALVARLLSEAAWKQYPQHADVAIERPIFVTGLPRTGTTALHRLLSADPRHQGLELWLAEFPQPRPPRETWSETPAFQQLDAQFTKAHNENPDYTGLHYMTADDVEECWQLLRQSLQSVSYETLSHIPTYARWLAKQDWTRPYQRHRKNLQLIGLNDAEKRWVLKNPQPPICARRVVRDVSRRAGDPVPPARGDPHGVDVLAGAAHHRGLVDHVRRRDDRARLTGDVVARAGAVQCRTLQT